MFLNPLTTPLSLNLFVFKCKEKYQNIAKNVIWCSVINNHIMVIPKSVNYFRCHKNINLMARNLVGNFDWEGLPTKKVATNFSSESSSFYNWDCWNHLRDLRFRSLNVTDYQVVFNFCNKKQVKNPNFFYVIYNVLMSLEWFFFLGGYKTKTKL
jgi:hypothetical protein